MHCVKLLISLGVCANLLACGSVPREPIRVEVPIPVPCAVKLPEPPSACVQKDEGRVEWLRCALADAAARQGYAAQLEAALKACVTLP